MLTTLPNNLPDPFSLSLRWLSSTILSSISCTLCVDSCDLPLEYLRMLSFSHLISYFNALFYYSTSLLCLSAVSFCSFTLLTFSYNLRIYCLCSRVILSISLLSSLWLWAGAGESGKGICLVNYFIRVIYLEYYSIWVSCSCCSKLSLVSMSVSFDSSSAMYLLFYSSFASRAFLY